MRTYSLITKPVRVSLKDPLGHTMENKVNGGGRFLFFEAGTGFWCARAWSEDHAGFQSIIIFGHSFIATYAVNSSVIKNKWEIVENRENRNWKDEIDILNSTSTEVRVFRDGSIPSYVPESLVQKQVK